MKYILVIFMVPLLLGDASAYNQDGTMKLNRYVLDENVTAKVTKLEWMAGMVASGALSRTIYNTILSGKGNHMVGSEGDIREYDASEIVRLAREILEECKRVESKK